MSWLAKSLVNSLKVDDDSDDEKDGFEVRKRDLPPNPKHVAEEEGEEVEEDNEQQQHHQDLRGVKDDLSELKKTLTRQFWGVASFLAPPPSSESSPRSPIPPSPPRQVSSADATTISDWNRWGSDQSISAEASDAENPDSTRISGLRSDFAEIGGKFRTGITKLSSNKAVSEISKIASTFLPPFGSEEESESDDKLLSGGGAVGVTDEVLTFARNISMHPETWLDFPLADDEDADDFDMSDAQQEHALAVEHLVPRLAALRIELCPGYMSEGCFWKIYFVLLHSRLSKHDDELLSTPQIVEARAMWMQELHNRTKTEPNWFGRGTSCGRDAPNSPREEHHCASSNIFSENQPVKTCPSEHTSVPVTVFETEKHPVVSTEMRIIDKSVVDEVPAVQTKNKDLLVTSPKILDQNFEEDGDEWLEEENSELGGFSGTTFPLGHEEDVSFSDLEEDDGIPTGSETVTGVPKSSAKDTQGWVQLCRSSPESPKEGQSLDKELGSEHLCANNNLETKDSRVSSDWLNVDKVDVV